MDQQHRIAGAEDRIVHLNAIDGRVAGLVGLGHGGRLGQGLPALLGSGEAGQDEKGEEGEKRGEAYHG